MRRMEKKAMSEWISYVLLVGFTVALAAFVYVWMTGYTSQSAQSVKERAYDSDLCDSLGVSVAACMNSSPSQNLYINVTNRGDLRITKLTFRFFQSEMPVSEIEIDSIINPQHTKNFSISQVNFTGVVNGSIKVEVIPETSKDNILVVCREKAGDSYFSKC